MNTDNMAINGETIDYGPCAFMDIYDIDTVFSSIDRHGSYAYGNQPKIAVWNLERFAETLLPLLHEKENVAIDLAEQEITKFWDLYQNYWLDGMRSKLGLFNKEESDELLINDLLDLMKQYKADYINTFRSLTLDEKNNIELFSRTEFHHWNKRWKVRLDNQKKSKDEIKYLMKKHNPAIIPRNHRVEEALLDAVNGNFDTMKKLLDALKNPYNYTVAQEGYSTLPSQTCGCYKTFCGT